MLFSLDDSAVWQIHGKVSADLFDRVTIGWIEEWVNNGNVRDGLRFDGAW